MKRYQLQFWQGTYYILDTHKPRIVESVHSSAVAASLVEDMNSQADTSWLRRVVGQLVRRMA